MHYCNSLGGLDSVLQLTNTTSYTYTTGTSALLDVYATNSYNLYTCVHTKEEINPEN